MGLGSEIRDPEKNLFRIPDPGVKKALDPGSATLVFAGFWIRIDLLQYWIRIQHFFLLQIRILFQWLKIEKKLKLTNSLELLDFSFFVGYFCPP
jgi:hypothetical protein